MDLIDRQEAIKAMSCLTDGICEGEAIEALCELPAAEPEPQWIPCSERLPEATGVYIVTCNIYNGDKVDGVTATWSYWRRNEWMMKDVLAWMPLPKPYGGEQDGDMPD